MNKKVIIGIIIAAIIPAAVYAGSPLFINTTIDEPLPSSAIKTSEMMEKSDTMMEETEMMEKSDTMMEETEMMEKSDTVMEKSEPVPITVLTGSFVGVNDGVHNAEGMAKVIPLDDGSKVLRLEDFESTNGPDLYVYLATDEKATEYVSLGELKANIGNQNYQIPEGTDLSKYDTALIWCKQFSVLFGHADLS
ncbi:MAG: DM13 domain-containing protein [Nitrososphaerota archaeon]